MGSQERQVLNASSAADRLQSDNRSDSEVIITSRVMSDDE